MGADLWYELSRLRVEDLLREAERARRASRARVSTRRPPGREEPVAC